MQETLVWSLDQKDSLVKGMATTPLPGESHGQRNVVGYSPWGHKESDTTDRLNIEHCIFTFFCLKIFLTWDNLYFILLLPELSPLFW